MPSTLNNGVGEGAGRATVTPAAPSSSRRVPRPAGALPHAGQRATNGRAGDTSRPDAGGNGADAPVELPEGATGSGPSPAPTATVTR